MHQIQANVSGTRHIDIEDKHLKTITKYNLLANMIDSTGVIDEEILDKLKLTVRSLLESEAGKDKDLLDLCLDVIYNQNMKALGLKNLIDPYRQYYEESKEDVKLEEKQVEN